jgi:hypothetical protein
VLVFAYACEPERGSEPGAGWGLVRSVAKFADCVVLVGPEHGPGLRRREEQAANPALRFIEIPEPMGAASAKLHRVTWFLLYLAWLRRADAVGRRLHRESPFDLTFHATYSTYWLPTPATSYGIPCVWGPVGGAVVTPFRLWPLLGFRGICGELLDLLSVKLLSSLPATRRTWHRATVALVQNPTTQRRLPDPVRSTSRVLNHAFFTEAPRVPRTGTGGGPCLFVGSLVARKGPRLALRALVHAPPDVQLVFLGDGGERGPLARLARRWGVADRVVFQGRVSRTEVFAWLGKASAVVFTGLREEGGIALAEALLVGVPVIVLDHGGAGMVATAAMDGERVALVRPGTIATTARQIGEAMGRFRSCPHSDVPLIDHHRWVEQLEEAFRDALRAGPPGSASLGDLGAPEEDVPART